jgi:hypothetical protein
VIFTPVTIDMRRRAWRRARRGRPPCREPGPHNPDVLTYQRQQHISTTIGSRIRSALPSSTAPSRDAILTIVSRAGLTPVARDGTIAPASTSLGEASARIQATDLERRKTPRVRTALPGLRVEPKWLPA